MPEFERSLQDIKEEIRSRSDIVDLISHYTSLKKAGKSFTGLCPFHNDKKPSFTVNPQFQSYKCWSCGEGGDIFTFVQKKENLDFVESLEWLAKRAGIAFERRAGDPQKASEREQALELNRLAVGFFKECLTRSQEGKEYLVKRAILKSTQEQWEIGFAPQDWDAFAYHLQRHQADMELAVRIGLIKPRENGGGYIDTFRNRLMFPIHDLQGRVIAFGGRAMDDHPAKYLNSPASLLFDKSRTLYGLYFAKKKIGGDTPPVFVEGYVDVMTTHQAGFTQCVATLGTAMTEQHAQMLKNYNPRVILCYDADRAGISAAIKGAAIWEDMGIVNAEVRVARLPNGDDPDSILRDRPNGAALFQAALDGAVPRVDFQMELAIRRHNLQTEQGRADALAEFIPILATIPQLTRRELYAQRFAYLSPMHNYDLGRAINSILADAETYARQNQNGRSPRDQGYPRTEDTNGQPLQEQPPPPLFRGREPNSSNQWGGGRQAGQPGQWPNTRQVTRKGEGNEYGGYRGDSNSGKNGYGNGRGRGRYKDSPIGDPTPPPLDAPALTGVEKAERQLLRALFSQEWRVYILSNARPELMVTLHGQRLFSIIARTPSNLEGGVDALPILHLAQGEEEETGNSVGAQFIAPNTGPLAAPNTGPLAAPNTGPLAAPNTGPLAAPNTGPLAAPNTGPLAAPNTGPLAAPNTGPLAAPNTELPAAPNKETIHNPEHPTPNTQHPTPNTQHPTPNTLYPTPPSVKFSDFIREVLEDSPFLASNERLNEAVIGDCMARLKKYRAEQELRSSSAVLQQLEHLTPDQQHAAVVDYQQKMRALRGSPPKEGEAQ